MEVEDEAVDMADIDELSMSILEPVPAMSGVSDAVAAEVGDVTITINCRGEINVDQSALAEVLGSGQQTARVTFVRVDDGGLSTVENQVDLDASELLAAVGQGDGGGVADVVDTGVNVGLMLDPDQLNKLEKVLESDEAKNILGDTMTEVARAAPPPPPSRRSQRQVDRETRQAAEKIRAENQEIMKKESGEKNNDQEKPTTEVSPTSRGRGKGMMRGGGGARPSRQRKPPKHLEDKEEGTGDTGDKDEADDDAEEEEEDADNDSDSGSWVSEDDPDRLWCVCQQPHSNKFMICCDQCLDWFHGKCVGITKAQGKEMEEAGQDWKCPKCVEGKSKPVGEGDDAADDVPAEMDTSENNGGEDPNEEFTLSQGKKKEPGRVKAKRKSSAGGEVAEKKKGASCHMCQNPARALTIYCSEECVTAHATQALAVLTKDGKTYKATNPVVVLEPKTNTLLTGPNAPTEASLESWLQSHKTFHVVMPGKKMLSRSSSSTGTPTKERSGPKLVAPHRETPEKKKQRIEDLIKKRPIKSKEEMVAEAKAALRRSVSSTYDSRPSKRERRNSDSTDRKPVPIKRKPEKPKPDPIEIKETKSSDKTLRSMVVKGTRDALLEKVKKSDLQIEETKILKIAEEIEIAMFGTFGDTGSKYKNKYRSLTYNIKDLKNDGLFRRILLKDLSAIEVVQMSADEYASKELQQWRKAEAAKDIEAIKTHELDMIALGNTHVMKTHKGEQVIETETAPSTTTAAADALLPEDEDHVKDTRDEAKLAMAKLAREAEKSAKKKHKKSDRHREKDRDRHRERHSSSKTHSSSSSSKDKKHSKDRDKSSHSKSDSSEKKHSSSSSRSASEKDKKKSSSSTSSKDASKEKHRHKSSSSQKPSSSDILSTSSDRVEAEAQEAPSTESQLDDLQARINKATAAIEAAKRSVADLGGVNETYGDGEEDNSVEEVPGSPLDLDLPSVSAGGGVSGPGDGEVSSTVTIPTPEQPESWSQPEEPSVWEGQVMMQDVAKFSVSAFQVYGTSDYLSVDLKSSLELVGRIPPQMCWDYIDKIGKNPTKEILVLKLRPSNNDEKDNYQSFFQYLSSRGRFGVVGNCNKNVKDCYIMPLDKTHPVPEALLALSGQGLPVARPDLLLTIIVRTKRSRAADSVTSKPAPSSLSLPSLALPPYKPPAAVPKLPPPPARLPPVAADDDNDPYSPGSSPELLDTSLPGSGSQSRATVDLGLTEKLARLQAEVSAKRAALAEREQLQLQPGPSTAGPSSVFAADMLGQQQARAPPPHQPPFGAPFAPFSAPPPSLGPAASSLSRMSDTDLLAAAEANTAGPRTLPPPGPGMPGNPLGHGMGNVELSREESYSGPWERRGGGGARGGHGGRGWGGGGDTWRGRGRDQRREHGGGWDRPRDWRERREDRDRGRDRGRGWEAEDYRRGRREEGRREYDRRDRDRDYRDRSRDRDRARGSRRSEETSRSKSREQDNLGTEDWSDDEIGDASGDTQDIHRNVADELANFDKQFGSAAHHSSNE